MLCIPQQTVEAAHSDICGSLFEKVSAFLLLIPLFVILSEIHGYHWTVLFSPRPFICMCTLTTKICFLVLVVP